MTSWGWILIASAVLGGLLTVGYLRFASRRLRLSLVAMLDSGDIVWVAQVREVLRRGLGASGVLVAQSDGRLVFKPDAASLKRGARPREWLLSQSLHGVGSSRWDISGLRYRVVSVQSPSGEAELRFAATQIVGGLAGLST